MYFLSSCHLCRNLAACMSPDTIAFKTNWPLKSGIELPVGKQHALGRHVKVSVNEQGMMTKVTCDSLAALFFGHSGRLFVLQEEYNDALGRIQAIVSAFAEAPPISTWVLSRLDIAWHLDESARPLILLHSLLRIPGFQSAATIFPDSYGLSWRVDRSRKMIRIYDEARKMRVGGSVTRAEVSLRGRHLSQSLQASDWLDLKLLWVCVS